MNNSPEPVEQRLVELDELLAYSVYEPRTPDLLKPYEQENYDEADVTKSSYTMDRNPSAQTGLRHQSRITANYLSLMALGGAVAATGLVVKSTPQAISVVAAAIIAPGFEPLAKIPMGLALRKEQRALCQLRGSEYRNRRRRRKASRLFGSRILQLGKKGARCGEL
jgi:hypothetical protein